VQFEPTKYAAIRACIARLHLTPTDVVFDIGCGMGRVTCLFAREPVARCIGIESVPGLAEIARRNAKHVRGRRAEMEIREGDAGTADYARGTIYWLYNPFGEDTMRRTLSRIRLAVEAAPRPIQIVYVAPNFERPFGEGGWLVRNGTIPVQYNLVRTMPASFWVNRQFRGGPDLGERP
jgi:predicted RNA methylase